jgi:ketosteroid isomerase-like protein
MAYVLRWEPQNADVAISCDLGYTTGPSFYKDSTVQNGEQRFGQFFSVWKKQSNGSWKVAVDIGVTTPTATFGTPFMEPTGERVQPSPVSSEEYKKIERDFSEACKRHGIIEAYRTCISMQSRLLRKGTTPIIGEEAIPSYLTDHQTPCKWVPLAGDVSGSGDLCYVYGSYNCSVTDSSRAESGFYLRMWKRNEEGTWIIVADITNRLAPDDK